jgi:hypothetical protein
MTGALVSACISGPRADDKALLRTGAGQQDAALLEPEALDLALTIYPSAAGCYLHGSIGTGTQSDAPSDTSRLRLVIDGVDWQLRARSSAISLVDADNPSAQRRWFGLELGQCPNVVSEKIELTDGEKFFPARLKQGGDSVYTVKLQPIVVEANGLNAAKLSPSYAARMAQCVGKVWSQKCHIAVDVSDSKVVPMSASEDVFAIRPIADATNPRSPFVYSKSAQSLFRSVATDRVPVFIGKRSPQSGAGFGNYSIPSFDPGGRPSRNS